MSSVPMLVWLLLAAGLAWLSVHGLRGWVEIQEALRLAELDRLSPPAHWPACRALAGALAALPVTVLARDAGMAALLVGLLIATLGYGVAPRILEAAKRRVQQQVLDELGPQLDLLAVAMESGCGWAAALGLCTERAPDGPLRRAWPRVLLEIHAGAEPLDALRSLEQRLRLPALTTLVSALRAAEKLQLPAGAILRERARHCAAARFARAERRARAAPLKLYAAMLLCLLPCTAFVLAFPLARWLARWSGQV
jgi:tight adherence protein C